MTRQDWINRNLSFFHVTQTRNVESILATGLENRNGIEVCVVRTCDVFVLNYIAEMMLRVDGDLDFSVIEIISSHINLLVIEVDNDNVVEVTNPLHNYIRRNVIPIRAENVINSFCLPQAGTANIENYESEIRQRFVLEYLT